jgi:hypothetical protein
MASAMDIDDEEIELPTSSSGKGEKKRFEVKKVIIDLLQLRLFCVLLYRSVIHKVFTFTHMSWLRLPRLKIYSVVAFFLTVECCCFVGVG